VEFSERQGLFDKLDNLGKPTIAAVKCILQAVNRGLETSLENGYEIESGDVVLVRTGWIQFWRDRKKYLSVEKGVPGVIEDGAKFLAGKGIALTGSDTTAYDRVPAHRRSGRSQSPKARGHENAVEARGL
jgi:kynurenine formamidase